MRVIIALALPLAFIAGCTATVLRPSYACVRVGLNEELEAAEQRSADAFRAMIDARALAGTCMELKPGQRVRVAEITINGAWKGIFPPGGPTKPYDYLWARSDALGYP